MICAAPGKLFTTGAYAILEGAPAIVVAVNRYALAHTNGPASTRPEVVEVARMFGHEAPAIDVSALESGGRKLGLGSSAAAAVACAGLLMDSSSKREIFDVALRAHTAVQPRGSGADVAAAAYGGVIKVQRARGELVVEQTTLPTGLILRAFALDRSARTSDALDRLAERRAAANHPLSRLIEAADAGATAVTRGDLDGFVRAAAAHVEGLDALGRVLDLPLVPPEVARARDVLFAPGTRGNHEEAALLPSGAGGGDTVLWLGARAPTEQEAAKLEELGLHALELELDPHGVHQR